MWFDGTHYVYTNISEIINALENTLSLGRNAAVRKHVEIRYISIKMQLRDCLETPALNEDKI